MRRHLTWTLGCCALIIWAGTQSWAYQGETSQPIGLTGIQAAYAPDGLTEEDFKALAESIDSTWKDWVLETGGLVKDFYEGEHSTIESQRAAIKGLRIKLKTMEKSLKDSRYAPVHDSIGDLYLKLVPEVDVAEAVLNTLTVDADAALRRRATNAANQLKSALAKFRSDMNKVNGGAAWLNWAMVQNLENFDPANKSAVEAVDTVKSKLEKRESYSDEIKKFTSRPTFLAMEDALAAVQKGLVVPDPNDVSQLREHMTALMDAIAKYREDPSTDSEAGLRKQFDVVRQAAPDGGIAISEIFASHYLNYNLRIAVSEGLLNRLAGDVRRENSGINQSAMGARIVGNQSSDVIVSVDVQPSAQNAKFDITVDGVISTNTNAYASQATIHTVGRHSVNARKGVIFNGTKFSTEPVRVSVRANNQPVGASTQYSGGLFGRMANRIAMSEANNRRGEANAYTEQSIRQEMSSELNSEVDSRFANASMELQNKVYGPLREYGLYPDAMSFTSSSTELFVKTRLTGENELGGGISDLGAAAPANGMVAEVHESLLTNSTNRLDLGTEGKTEMTEGQLKALIKERLEKILDREIDFGDNTAAEEGNTFVFDQPNPIRFMIKDGEVILSLRAGLKREGDNIPTQIITVPLIPTVSGDKVLINRGNVGVKPVDRPSSVAEQVARANVMRQKIQAALPEREMDATFEIEQNNKKIKMHVKSISAHNGWLKITLQ